MYYLFYNTDNTHNDCANLTTFDSFIQGKNAYFNSGHTKTLSLSC